GCRGKAEICGCVSSDRRGGWTLGQDQQLQAHFRGNASLRKAHRWEESSLLVSGIPQRLGRLCGLPIRRRIPAVREQKPGCSGWVPAAIAALPHGVRPRACTADAERGDRIAAATTARPCSAING